MIDVPMPQLGESVAEGTVTKWLVKEGDWVERDQVLLEVATDKADTEVHAPESGVVTKVVAEEGAIIAKGGLLCQIDESAEKPAGGGGSSDKSADASTGSDKSASEGAPTGGDRASTPPRAAPSTRRLALEQGVDVRSVAPTGEHGRTTREDVLKAAKSASESAEAASTDGATPPKPAAVPQSNQELAQLIQAGGGFVPPIPGVGFGAYKVPAYRPKQGDQVVPFSRRRRITADHMVYSKLVSPHVVTVAEVDLYATAKLRDAHKAAFKKSGVPLTYLAFICMATVKALREHPELNARVLDNSYVVLRDVNLGVAVDTPGGLVVPSIKNADQLSLRGIAAGIDEMAGRARAGKITADDLSGTTFSVSNPGLKGNLFGGAIISQPNVGILRMGEIKKRVVVVTGPDGEDSIAIHPVMYMALSYDHRIVDGVHANSFLWRVADLLTQGEFEV